MIANFGKSCALAAITLTLGLTVALAPAEAGWHHFRGGAVVAWGPEDIGLWRGGYWHHGVYGSRVGWWWAVGGAYYWYPEAVYPYPSVASEVVVTQTPTVITPPAAAPSYYYCDNPAGYYPQIQVCNQPFRPVSVVPQH
jgi:hypothetical protein